MGKGTSKEQAINNLRKAWAKRKESSDSLQVKQSSDLTSESSKREVEETSVSIMNSLGRHVNKLSSESSSDKLLKNAYGFKSLADTYHNYIKLVYPYGLHVSTSDHMNHLLGSIMPSLQKMLTVNINVDTPKISTRDSHVVDISDETSG